MAGVFSVAILGAVTAKLGGQRDTPRGPGRGRRLAGRGRMLGEQPTFAEQPPAGVAIWDRHIAYGAALGVSHGAVAALPLGAESEHEAWSPVAAGGGSCASATPSGSRPGTATTPPWWRSSPACASPPAASCGPAADGAWATPTGSTWACEAEQARDLQAGLEVAAFVILIPLLVFTAFWRGCLAAGLADMVSGRRLVQGRVLRGRRW